jgi:hypothetical protein
MWQKKSSDLINGTVVISKKQTRYFGFVCITGGTNRTILIYDSDGPNGKVVEAFVCDSNKPTDGHSHATPVLCKNGLCVVSPVPIVVYYNDEIS